MNVTLTIQEKLKDLRVESGLTLEQLEKQTGISRSALGQYENDEYKDISHTSIVTLAKFYGVSADYLLGLMENRNHSNTDLQDLHLSDDMIALLKNGEINTRLLCELAAHKDFVKLMADIEIYVDGSSIILKKYEPTCVFCGDAKNITVYKGKNICANCLKELKKA